MKITIPNWLVKYSKTFKTFYGIEKKPIKNTRTRKFISTPIELPRFRPEKIVGMLAPLIFVFGMWNMLGMGSVSESISNVSTTMNVSPENVTATSILLTTIGGDGSLMIPLFIFAFIAVIAFKVLW